MKVGSMLNWKCRRCKAWFRTILQLEYHDKFTCQIGDDDSPAS